MSKYLLSRNNPFGFIDPFFDEFFTTENTNHELMRTDIIDEGDHFEMKIELPDVKKEDLKVSLKEGNLTITATYNKESNDKDKNGKFIRRERHYGNYSRSFYVGEDVEYTDIKARLDNGVLNLDIAKKEKPIQKEDQYIAIE